MRAKKKWENFQNCYKNLFSAGQLLWEGSMLNGTKHVKIFLCKQGHVLQKVTTAIQHGSVMIVIEDRKNLKSNVSLFSESQVPRVKNY
jgi:hypothetical protein